MRFSGTALSWKHSVACTRSNRATGLTFWKVFFPTKERSSMDTKTYWAQTYKFHTCTASDTRDFHWSKAVCYLLRFSMLQSKTFPYYKIIFELLDDPSSRPWVKNGLQVSKCSLFHSLESPLWCGQPHSKEQEWILHTYLLEKGSDLLSLCWPAGFLYRSSLLSMLSICWDCLASRAL